MYWRILYKMEEINMSFFTYKDVYFEEGVKVLEVNLLPEKYCNFDCIFCPIGRSQNKIDEKVSFDDQEQDIKELLERIDKNEIELVFINSKGEAFVNEKLSEIVDLIKSKNVKVRLLSNGYVLGKDEYRKIANKCDEVIGELKVLEEEDFQKMQRPITGYTIEEYISNMIEFNKQYKGKFIFEITIIKGYNDDQESITKLKAIIKQLQPEEIQIVRLEEEHFQKKLGISDERFEQIKRELM